jgi:hypothetical protein
MRLPGRPYRLAVLTLPALLLNLGLVACQPSQPGPGIQRCVGWWNDPQNRTYRLALGEALSDRPFPLVTIRSIGPNKAGQPGCVALLREREDGPWLLAGAVVTNDGGPVRWTVDEQGRQYGSDSPTGNWDDSPNATLHPDQTIELR